MTRNEKELDSEVLKAIRKSAEKFKQLYPILLDANGEMIDGDHRNKVFKTPEKRTLDYIKTKKDRLEARLVANHARNGQHKETWELNLKELAEILQREGVERIGMAISEETGLPYRTIMKYLPSSFKDASQSSRASHPRLQAGSQLEREPEALVEAPARSLVQSPAKSDPEESMNEHAEQKPLPPLKASEVLEEYSKAEKDEMPRIELRNFMNQPWKAIILPKDFYAKLEKASIDARVDMEEVITLALVKLLIDLRSKARCLDKQ